MKTTDITRRGRAVALIAVGLAAVAGAGCREHWRIDDVTAAELNDPERRHAIGHARELEALFIELGGKGEGLSANQRADVHRFIKRYKSESDGRLSLTAPGTARGHLVVSQMVRDILDMVRDAEIPERAVDISRFGSGESTDYGPAVRLAYRRVVAVAPHCGTWPENLARNRELVPFENFGCATQRNLALTVANGRDLRVPQEESPRSSERRSTTWSQYVDPQGAGGSPAPAPSGGGGQDPGAKGPQLK